MSRSTGLVTSAAPGPRATNGDWTTCTNRTCKWQHDNYASSSSFVGAYDESSRTAARGGRVTSSARTWGVFKTASKGYELLSSVIPQGNRINLPFLRNPGLQTRL
ncbi:hypothetical protein ACVIN2_005788 [Bradyrhizobium sp. USDA 3650]